jgi:hypothetical protein
VVAMRYSSDEFFDTEIVHDKTIPDVLDNRAEVFETHFFICFHCTDFVFVYRKRNFLQLEFTRKVFEKLHRLFAEAFSPLAEHYIKLAQK